MKRIDHLTHSIAWDFAAMAATSEKRAFQWSEGPRSQRPFVPTITPETRQRIAALRAEFSGLGRRSA